MKNSPKAKSGGIFAGQQTVNELRKNDKIIQKSAFKSNLVKTVNKRVNNPYKL
jgi:hypothetical protein